ncbi:MAG: ABC transporter ATP-binding protein/permease [Anaerolineae bacterium]|nr:ABC transporter ATP-binding protein/permease [Anaerolineae bacterium]
MSDRRTHNLQEKLSLDLKSTLSDSRSIGLFRLMQGFRWLYFGALAAVALGALVRTYYYQLLQYVVDEVFGNPEAQGRLPLVAAAFVGLAVAEGLFAYLRSIWSAQTAEGITLRLRDYLLDHIQRLPFSFHDYVKTGELIQRATSDVDAVRRFYADQALGIGRILALFVVNFTMLMSMSPRLAWTSIAVMPFIVGTSYFFFGRVSKAYKAFQKQEAKLSTVLQENLTGVRVVRAFARQSYEIDKFESENLEKYRRGRRLTRMHALYWPLSDVMCAVQTILAIAVGAMMGLRGEITIGTYMAAMGMVIWIIWPMRNMGRLIVNVSTGLVSYQRVAEMIREDREEVESGSVPMDTPVRGAVEFKDVTFAYEPQSVLKETKPRSEGRKSKAGREQTGGSAQAGASADAPPEPVEVLHGITFRCDPGQSVALLGSTGSGKTSIINLLLRFYDHQSGSITLDGVPLGEYPRAMLRSIIGIVEQEPFLFSRSIGENIAYGSQREVSPEEVEEAAKAAAIHDIILTFPEGYNTVVGERGVTLSGGQRQRVAIARALLKDPRILVLDDATSSVDTETEEQIQDALGRLMADRTTFLVAHRIQTVMSADLILVLDKGAVVQSGTHAELVQQDGLYRDIFDIQSQIDEEVRHEVEFEPSATVT